ncbi:hypothetical protein Dvar_24680 [Desulfosarcina variabilis str. Montpellier]|uniref:hypothetical protein n=1 Tax=Desulfosarcina variabilis TaxID=2300 RepID=UPI003AFA1242
MSMNFQIKFKRENGDLHVNPVGDFDGSSAWELIHLIHEQYGGQGHVHIDTGRLKRVCPFGCNTFQCQFYQSRIPAHRLLIKGKNGPALAPKGSRVEMNSQPFDCGCDGNCAHCHCASEAMQKESHLEMEKEA